MGCDTKLFIQNGVDVYALGKYIEKKYGKGEVVDANVKAEVPCYSIFFDDKNGEPRRIWFYTYASKNDGETPAQVIEGESCNISLGYWGNSVEILQDIAKNFGGGYIQENDCGFEDGTDEWKYVNGANGKFTTDIETKVFELVQNAEDKGNLSTVKLTKFILSHLDEIKKI